MNKDDMLGYFVIGILIVGIYFTGLINGYQACKNDIKKQEMIARQEHQQKIKKLHDELQEGLAPLGLTVEYE